MTNNTCGKNIIVDNQTGETICGCGCGTVLEQGIISFARPLSNNDESDPVARLYGFGPKNTPLMHDGALSTIIPISNTDHVGDKINAKSMHAYAKLRRQNRLSIFSVTKVSVRMIHILTVMDNLCDKLGLGSSIKERSAYLVRKIIKEEKLKNHSINGICIACIYLTCKERNVTLTDKQMKKVIGLTHKSPLSCILEVSRALDYKIAESMIPKEDEVNGIILSICRGLKIESKVKQKALKLYKEIDEQNLKGSRTAQMIAGATVYLAVTHLQANHHADTIGNYLHISPSSVSWYANEYARSLGMIIRRQKILYI